MSNHRRAIAAALLLAALPTSALAATETDYRVTYEVDVTHEQDRLVSDSSGTSRSSVALHTKLNGDLGTITFRDGRLVSASANTPVEERHTGTLEARATTAGWGGAYTSSCRPTDSVGRTGHGAIESPLLTSLTTEDVVVRLTDALSPGWTCTGALSMTMGPTGIFSTQRPLGEGPLDASFDLPFEATRSGKILQHVSGAAGTNHDGPCFIDDEPWAGSQRCAFNYDGWITFVRTAQRQTTDDGGGAPAAIPATSAPAAAASPSSAPAPAPAPDKPQAAPAAAPLAPAAAKIDGAASRVTFVASCPTGCAGTAVLNAAGTLAATGARAASGTRAGSPRTVLTFTVPAGTAQRVALPIPRTVRRALRRTRRGSLAIELRAAGQPLVASSVALRLPRS